MPVDPLLVGGPVAARRRWRPRLRSLLLLSNLVVLSLPLAGLYFLRLYESALIRQTEAELVAQAAVLASAFRTERQHRIPGGDARPPAPMLRAAALDRVRRAGLDLARDAVLPPAPDPAPSVLVASDLAAETGQVLTPILRDAQQVTLAAIRIVDERGVIIATTGTDAGASLAAQEEIQRALAGEPVSNMRRREKLAEQVPDGLSRASWLRVFVALPVVQDGQVVAAVLLSRTPYTLVQAVWGKRYELGLLAAGLVAAVLALALGASRLITQPLRRLVRQAQGVAANRLDSFVPLARPGTRDVRDLSAAITRMAGVLEQRATYIRNFAAHVSHEFKTPLAGMRGVAELMVDHDATMSAAERAHFLGVIEDGVARLDKLVSGLLDLARADMMRAETAISVHLRPLLDRLAADARTRGLDVAVRCDDLHAGVPAEALEMILGQLLDNALTHGGPDTAVDIRAYREGPWLRLEIMDNGRGIPPEDAGRVFDPFFTTRRAGSTGLGLAIAHAAVTGAGGTIQLLPARIGTHFRLMLPGGTAPRHIRR